MVWVAGEPLQGGEYIIENKLGEGGFGITYKALYVPLNQPVVIKTLNESLQNDPEYPKYVQRFINEGQRVAKLSANPHPSIVRISNLFEENGLPCLVMDFIEGESLFDIVQRRKALPENEALEYILQIGSALSVVHKAGLVHRDAHPNNIMLQSNGRAVLIDFGIAGETASSQRSSKIFANKAFAPYEQIYGRHTARKPTVDIYTLAASLYYAVTGQVPTSSLEQKLHNVSLLPPQQHNQNLSDKLNRAILKGMKLEAKNRPQSMQEWLKLLEVANRTMAVSPQAKARIIPWWWLAGIFIIYTLTSLLFTLSWAPSWVVIIGVLGSGFSGELAALALAAAAAGSVAVILAKFWTGAVALAVVVAWSGVGATAVVLAKAWHGIKSIAAVVGVAIVMAMAWTGVSATLAGVLAGIGAVVVTLAGALAGMWAANGTEALEEFVDEYSAKIGATVIILVVAVAVALTGTKTEEVSVIESIVAASAAAASLLGVNHSVRLAKEQLKKSFNRWHTFLILTGTACFGLGLGSLIYSMLG
ncbi:MAG: serine/threonine protein kinase [Symploca sp. SIO2C1]|nr:serine/threonine protein kinase [Symploca sp. SIO2C1]